MDSTETKLNEIQIDLDSMITDYSSDYSTIRMSDYNINISDTITLNNTGAISGAMGATYQYPNVTIANGAYTTSAFGNVWGGNPLTVGGSGQVDLTGENADIKINGKSLCKAIEAIEQRLNILTPNTKLEAEWDELRELGERYRELEKQCLEKAEMWKKLKSMAPPEIV